MNPFETISHYAGERIPFIFIIDFDSVKPVVLPVSQVDPDIILFNFNGITNCESPAGPALNEKIQFKKTPVSRERYIAAFDYIQQNQRDGNSYLANLTFPTEIEMSPNLKDIFFRSSARYRLWFRDEFVLFSPEIFVTIKDNIISSYPMKGTIDASIPGAEEIILNDQKESAEHLTIVDLIRNDLSRVAKNVAVEKYRYIEKIKTSGKDLLQVSSIVTGKLEDDYRFKLGEILQKLLPAGSVTGAPKRKTVEIIKKAENYDRGYYCGICGIFDGSSLDSGVMIRYMEKINGKYFFKSGGGITVYSDPVSEYREMVDKVNLPVV